MKISENYLDSLIRESERIDILRRIIKSTKGSYLDKQLIEDICSSETFMEEYTRRFRVVTPDTEAESKFTASKFLRSATEEL